MNFHLLPDDYDVIIDDAFAYKSKKLLEGLMKNYLTATEWKMLDLCDDLIISFGPGKVQRTTYRQLMHKVAQMKRFLENKRFGCPAGTHDDICYCEERNVA